MKYKSVLILSLFLSGTLFLGQAHATAAKNAPITLNPHRAPPQTAPTQAPATSASNGSAAPAGSVHFETCFSPAGSCDQKLIIFINVARSSLDVAIYSITHPGIADAIKAAKARGVKVRMVVDRSQSKGNSSLVDALRSDGIDLKIGNFSGIMHDKFTIVDDRFLETGSYNYSNNATANNGENQLYLDDPSVVSNYLANFETIFADALAN